MPEVDAPTKNEIIIIYESLKIIGQIYADIWNVGCQLGLRISDLLNIEFSHIDLDAHNTPINLTLIETKTRKRHTIRINDNALKVIRQRKADNPHHQFLFQVESNRQKGQAIHRNSVFNAFKKASATLDKNIGTHSMRKAKGMMMYEANVPIALIAKVLNHASEACTLRYLGITKNEVLQSYDDFAVDM